MTRRKIEISDIRFQDERLNRLMEGVRRIADEMQRVQQILESGAAGTVLTKLTGRDYETDWVNPATAGGGEANTGNNVGAGAQVFLNKTGVTLNFRTLRGQGGITVALSGDGNEILINGTGASGSGETLDALVVAGAF